MKQTSESLHQCPEDLLPLYVLGSLNADELEAVERHLSHCARCRQQVEQARQTTQLLAYLAPPQPVPARVRHKLRTSLRPSPLTVPLRGLIRRPAVAAALIASILALLFGWQLADQQRATRQSAQQALQADSQRRAVVQLLAQRDGLLIRLRGTGTIQQAQGAIILNPANNTAFIAVEGLPRPATGQAYVVWLVRGEDYQPAGILPVDERGHAELFLSPRESLRLFDALAITLETGTWAEGPGGTAVAFASLN